MPLWRSARTGIARLRFRLARYRRAEYGRSSERLAREAAQREGAIEGLEENRAERLATAASVVAAAIESATEAQKPARRPLPDPLPREDALHPPPCTRPSCGGAPRRIGGDMTETLDYVPGRFGVIRHIREKLSRRTCDTGVAAPAPDRAIARGAAPAPGCWPISSSPSTTIICRFIGRPRSSARGRPAGDLDPAFARAGFYPAGSVKPRPPWSRSSRPLGPVLDSKEPFSHQSGIE